MESFFLLTLCVCAVCVRERQTETETNLPLGKTTLDMKTCWVGKTAEGAWCAAAAILQARVTAAAFPIVLTATKNNIYQDSSAVLMLAEGRAQHIKPIFRKVHDL